MANVHGIGDFAAPGGGGGGEYSALRGNQGALGGQYAAGGGGGWDQFGMDQGVISKRPEEETKIKFDDECHLIVVYFEYAASRSIYSNISTSISIA